MQYHLGTLSLTYLLLQKMYSSTTPRSSLPALHHPFKEPEEAKTPRGLVFNQLKPTPGRLHILLRIHLQAMRRIRCF